MSAAVVNPGIADAVREQQETLARVIRALDDARNTNKPQEFDGSAVGRQAPQRLTARPDGIVVDAIGRIAYQRPATSLGVAPTPGPQGPVTPPWEEKRLRLRMDARTAGHAAFSASVLAFGYLGMRIGEKTGRHFQWTLIGVAAGVFVGDVARDSISGHYSREAEVRQQNDVFAELQRQQEALSRAMNPNFGSFPSGSTPGAIIGGVRDDLPQNRDAALARANAVVIGSAKPLIIRPR